MQKDAKIETYLTLFSDFECALEFRKSLIFRQFVQINCITVEALVKYIQPLLPSTDDIHTEHLKI